MSAVHRALKNHFGFDKFRSQQQEDAVKAVLKGDNDTFTLDYYGENGRSSLNASAVLLFSDVCVCVCARRWQGCVCMYAHRSRQVSVLSAPSSSGQRHHSGHFSSHRAHPGEWILTKLIPWSTYKPSVSMDKAQAHNSLWEGAGWNVNCGLHLCWTDLLAKTE